MPRTRKPETKRARRKYAPKSFHCKEPGCRFKATGPSKLGQHYKANPAHASSKSRQARLGKNQIKTVLPQKKRERPKEYRTARRRALKVVEPEQFVASYCENCGHKLRRAR